MILPIKYDNYKEYDVNRQLQEQGKDFRVIKQELLKQQLSNQQTEMNQRKRSITTQKQKEEMIYLENVKREQDLHKYMENQNKQFVKNDLNNWYNNSLNNQRITQAYRRQEQDQIEKQIIETAKLGETMAQFYTQQKKNYYKQVQDQQLGLYQVKKLNEQKSRQFDQAVYKEQINQENEKIQKKLDHYKQYYQDVQNKQEQLQARYIENYRDPKQGLDDIIRKNVQQKQENDERDYLIKQEQQNKLKQKYNSILSIQQQESQQKKQNLRYDLQSLGYQQQSNSVYNYQTDRQNNISTPAKSIYSEQNYIYNPLTNPNPNQTQNPYLLKQLGLNIKELPTPEYAKSKLASMGKFCIN